MARRVPNNVIAFPAWPRRRSLVGVLDIGHSKICCLLAEPPRLAVAAHDKNHDQNQDDNMPQPRLVGFGEVATRHTSFLYPDYFQKAVRMALGAAEQMAGARAKRLLISSSFLPIKAERRAGHIALQGMIDDQAYRQVLQASFHRFDDDERAVLHAIVLSCAVDEQASLRDPRGLQGDELRMAMLGISAPTFHLRRLQAMLAQTHLQVEKYVAPAYASALGASTQDEREQGFLCLDIGARRTGLALYSRGVLVHVGEVPMGGWHISNDIALACDLPFAVAERAKLLFGHAQGLPPNETMRYEHLLPGESGGKNGTGKYGKSDDKSYMIDCMRLGQAIHPRVEELVAMARAQLEDAGLASARWKRVLLAGGGSELRGLPELLRMLLRKPVRRPVPPPVAGRYALSARHMAAFGVLRYLHQCDEAQMSPAPAAWTEYLSAEKIKTLFHKFGESINP